MAPQRLTADFVHHFKNLKERTGNSRHNLRKALDRDPALAVSIRELDRIHYRFEKHRRESPLRFIPQADREFPKLYQEYRDTWFSISLELGDWEDDRAGRPRFSDVLTLDLDAAGVVGVLSDEEFDEDDWDFKPDEHSAGALVGGMSDYASNRSVDGAFFSRAAGAFRWFGNTVGVDYCEIEERFKEFPVIAIPEQVSNQHGLRETRSLFSYLTDLRISYVAGADLSALAMCRACTEILIRHHYAHDHETKLTPLIRLTQQKAQFAFLRPFNLVEKVQQANDMLHAHRTDIESRNQSRLLVRGWVSCLVQMIGKAPA